MKKHLINIINFLLLLGLLTGCASNKDMEVVNESGYAIYEIGGGTLDMEVDINHQYETKSSIQVLQDDSVPRSRTISLFGKEYDLEYKETHYFTIGDYTRHRYIATNAEQASPDYTYTPGDLYDSRPSVIFQDSTDQPIGFSGFYFTSIEMTDTMTEEDIFDAVEETMGEYVDFSQYNERTVQGDVGGDGSCYLYWKKKIGDYYLANYIDVTVSEGGGLRYFEIVAPPTPGTEEPSADTISAISEESTNALLDSRLHQIYDTETCELVDYDIARKRYTRYEGKDSIYYQIDVEAELNGEEYLDQTYLLITLE